MWGGSVGERAAPQGLWPVPWGGWQCLHLLTALPADWETGASQQSNKGKDKQSKFDVHMWYIHNEVMC